jgi:hypothetical protein
MSPSAFCQGIAKSAGNNGDREPIMAAALDAVVCSNAVVTRINAAKKHSNDLRRISQTLGVSTEPTRFSAT